MTNTANQKPEFPQQVTGMYILAQALRRVGLDTVYGLVGIPVTEAAYAMQKCDVKFVGFRFEQQGKSGDRDITPVLVIHSCQDCICCFDFGYGLFDYLILHKEKSGKTRKAIGSIQDRTGKFIF